MERDSSDEEDDREHLVEQNDRKHHRNDNNNNNHHILPTSSPTRRRSPFELDSRIRQHRLWNNASFNFNNRYSFFAIVFLPLVIILLYFSTDIRNLFSTNLSTLRVDNYFSNLMRESELRALYLLKQQQLSLFSLWNQSNSISNDSTVNSTFSKNKLNSVAIGDLKSAMLKQIALNKEIQQVLLSTHKSGNDTSTSIVDGNSGFVEPYQRCKKVDQRRTERKTVEWKPKSNKFLFAICLSGQMSNHLICLEKHMFLAALLNRILVIPSSKFDYQYNRVLDIERINECLGRKVVVTFEEFAEIKKNKPHINRFICFFSEPTPCYVDEEHAKKLKGVGVSMAKLESPWKEDIKKPSKHTVEDILGKFGTDDDVIAVGDMFYAAVEEEWAMQPGGPIAHKCKTLIEPAKLIMLTAERFIQTFLGNNFIALHFRRHGFLKFCNAKKPSCFYPIPQAADCIARVVERANAPVVYLSTDAAESETDLLHSLLVVNGRAVPLVKRPPRNSAEKWDALLYRHGLQEDSQVEAMLDKTICAMSNAFIGASGSTFTEDILRLRKGWESASSCDEYLCEGELPNFIAGDE